MSQEAILCIPGPWTDRTKFIEAIIEHTPVDRFVFAGRVLAHISGKDHVSLEFCGPYEGMREAFRIAGQGRISEKTLDLIQNHGGVAYLHFPMGWREQSDRLVKFTKVLRDVGGFAVSIESSGVAHEWDRWFYLLTGELFDIYCSVVNLIGGEERYYSCGMHHFGLPECSFSYEIDSTDVADLINRFNMYRIVEKPQLASGHTFSLTPEAPRFRLTLTADSKHQPDDPFHNPHGVWELKLVD